MFVNENALWNIINVVVVSSGWDASQSATHSANVGSMMDHLDLYITWQYAVLRYRSTGET